jgi:hypothetical protein
MVGRCRRGGRQRAGHAGRGGRSVAGDDGKRGGGRARGAGDRGERRAVGLPSGTDGLWYLYSTLRAPTRSDPTALYAQHSRCGNAVAAAECGARGGFAVRARLVLPLAVRDVPALLLGRARLAVAVGRRRFGRVLRGDEVGMLSQKLGRLLEENLRTRAAHRPQHVATCRAMLQHVATGRGMLQHVAPCCNTLRQGATCCAAPGAAAGTRPTVRTKLGAKAPPPGDIVAAATTAAAARDGVGRTRLQARGETRALHAVGVHCSW